MAHETFRVGDLTAVIGDDEAYENHRAGYNGIHRLTHRTNPRSLFIVAGLNHEHIFDGDKDLRGDCKITLAAQFADRIRKNFRHRSRTSPTAHTHVPSRKPDAL